MKRSTERILTTHAGSLPRPLDLQAMIRAQQYGQPYDQNVLSERVLRPAVIAHKVSHCSKTWPGAYALAAFTSVMWKP